VLLRETPETRTGRRKARRRKTAFVLACILVAGGVVSGAIMLPHRSHSGAPRAATQGARNQTAVLFATTAPGADGADSLTLFVSDPRGRAPVAVFLPVGTLAPIPSQGVDTIGSALTHGDELLARLTVANLLGVRVADSVTFSTAALQLALDSLGGIDVDVEEQLFDEHADGTRTLAFPLGANHLSAAQAVRYMTMRSDNELDRFVRARKTFEAMFARGAQRVADAVRAEPGTRALAAVWRAFAAAAPAARTYDVLPADPVGAGPDEVYRPVASKIDEMVMRDLASLLPVAGVAPSARPRIELRNGIGSPQAGERAAARLIPAGFRIEVTGNAPQFGNVRTQIVVYGDDVSSASLGARLRSALGAGSVVAGARTQTIVDATVVLGEDFQ
jgi:hypothetical protein